MQFIRFLLGDLLPEAVARVNSIELESKRPTFRILIVILEDVHASDVLPLIDGFLDRGDVEQGEEGGFASPEVAFDRDNA
jgi:hypothetical protein